MDGNSIYEDLTPVRRRARAALLVVEVLFIVTAVLYWKMQILDFRKYWSMSEANRIREAVLPAPRGLVTDRGGTAILADNRASFKASFVRENVRDLAASLQTISGLLDLDVDVLRERIEKYKALPAFRPVVVKDDLTLEEVSRIEGRKLDLPELVIETEPRRHYPFGSLAAHVLGSMQEVTPDELRSGFQDRRPGDMIGRTGIEAAYETRLAGVDGALVEVVDSQGRLRENIRRIEPVPSPKLVLTIDYDLQAKAEELLAGREGAIVALDPRTGDILALASSPTYDPNKFINRFTPEEWQGLVTNPDFPLIDRALQGLYAPGSVFKPVMAVAGLESGVISAQTTFFCGGTALFYDRPTHCWFEGGHGHLDLSGAIKNSCNIYFYNLGSLMAVDTIAHYAETLGLGAKTGIEITGEKEGLVPTTAWKKQTAKAPWYPGETISVAIGQGPLQVTPLQIAVMTATIASRGLRATPRLVAATDANPALPASAAVSRATFDKVVEGMWRSVNEGGTGQGARVEGLNVCGKTGSTQTISRETAERLGARGKAIKTHSWFTGFAPRDDPRIVVTVLVEFGGMGGATAAPVAGKIFTVFGKRDDR
jgi:penicillin-binding protein 2